MSLLSPRSSNWSLGIVHLFVVLGCQERLDDLREGRTELSGTTVADGDGVAQEEGGTAGAEELRSHSDAPTCAESTTSRVVPVVFVLDSQDGLLKPDVGAGRKALSVEGNVSAKGSGLPDAPELAETYLGTREDFAWFEVQLDDGGTWVVGANLMPGGFQVEVNEHVTASLDYVEDSPYPRSLMFSVERGSQPIFVEFDNDSGWHVEPILEVDTLSVFRGDVECWMPVEVFECDFPHHVLRVQGHGGEPVELGWGSSKVVGDYKVSHYRTDAAARSFDPADSDCPAASANDFFPGRSHLRIEARPGDAEGE